METPVSAPTAEVVTAIRRVCMIVREAERSMPPSSFNVMKMALFTVCQKYALFYHSLFLL